MRDHGMLRVGPMMVAALAAALLSSACGASSRPSDGRATDDPATTAAVGLDTCLRGTGAEPLSVPTLLPSASVALLGSARRVVVLSNESDEDLCSWISFAADLQRHGFAVVMYDYSACPATPQQCLVALTTFVRTMGYAHVDLIGASEGAKASIVAGASLTPPPDAVVSLSAETILQRIAVAPFAARLTAPTLFVTAGADPYGATAATRAYYASSPAHRKQLLVVAGTAHGIALLVDAGTAARVIAFLSDGLPAG